MKKELENLLVSILNKFGVAEPKVSVEHPDDLTHGDFATSAALAYAKELKMSPRQLAEKIVTQIPTTYKVEIAGPGFINFSLPIDFFAKSLEEIIAAKEKFGSNNSYLNQQVMVEYTDPNPFKEFHIGHLMNNALGESVSRLIEAGQADIVRAFYSGDVGLHVAKAIWGYQTLVKKLTAGETKVLVYGIEKEIVDQKVEIKFWGFAYTYGSSEYDSNPESKDVIDKLNKEIVFTRTPEIDKLYQQGREVSLKHFYEIFDLLGTKFNRYFFESEMVDRGLEIVKKGQTEGVFEDSEKAVVFRGEKYDPALHTRVFINSFGVPTYETKELALNEKKFELYPSLAKSIIVTANEQSGYFKVVLKALSLINPKAAERTQHISHGMLRFASGKMGSRKGNVITGEAMIEDVEEMVREKIKDRELSPEEKEEIVKKVAVGAIRYSILKQEAGKDIIFDFEKSLSFEGDSGPYLQYTAVRAGAVLAKAENLGIKELYDRPVGEIVSDLEKKLYRFPEVVERCQKEYSSHYLATYLTDVASEFNSYYANNQIANKDEVASGYRVALTKALRVVLVNGLWLLGVEVPNKM
ncbi:MAG: arginine--tRNA ligase [bacterium]